LQPFPYQDSEREARVIQDVLDTLRNKTVYDPASKEVTIIRQVKRWITHVLSDANERRKWWFLENVATKEIAASNDIIDLRGHVDKISAVYCPQRLRILSLEELTELRQLALTNNSNNAASKATHYAIESGHRIHLWPCPSAPVSLSVIYTRPMHVAIVPNSWEVIILNGIIGMFGQHFDKDALVDNPSLFERRYNYQLNNVKIPHHDTEIIERFKKTFPAFSTIAANSSTDTGTDYLAPASLTGIGYETLEAGDYPLKVT